MLVTNTAKQIFDDVLSRDQEKIRLQSFNSPHHKCHRLIKSKLVLFFEQTFLQICKLAGYLFLLVFKGQTLSDTVVCVPVNYILGSVRAKLILVKFIHTKQNQTFVHLTW